VFFKCFFLKEKKTVLGWEREDYKAGVKEGGKGTKKNQIFFTQIFFTARSVV
jgi:hypothetical protein